MIELAADVRPLRENQQTGKGLTRVDPSHDSKPKSRSELGQNQYAKRTSV